MAFGGGSHPGRPGGESGERGLGGSSSRGSSRGGSRGGGGGFSVNNSGAGRSGFSGVGSFGAPKGDGGIGGFRGTSSLRGAGSSFGRGGGGGSLSRSRAEAIYGSQAAAGAFARRTNSAGADLNMARGSHTHARADAKHSQVAKVADKAHSLSSTVAPTSHPMARGDATPDGPSLAEERAASGSTTATAMRDAILADAREDSFVTSALKAAPVIGPAVRAVDVVAESVNAANRINALEGVPAVSAMDVGAQLATEEAAGAAMGLVGGELAGRVAGGIASNFTNSPVSKGLASVAGKLGGSALGRSFGRAQAQAYGPMGTETLDSLNAITRQAPMRTGGDGDNAIATGAAHQHPSLYMPVANAMGRSIVSPVTFNNYSSYAKAVFA